MKQHFIIITGIVFILAYGLIRGFRLLTTASPQYPTVDLAQNTSLRDNLEMPMQSKSNKIDTIENKVLNTLPVHELSHINKSAADLKLEQSETIRIMEGRIQKIKYDSQADPKRVFRMREQLRLSKIQTELKTLDDWVSTYNGRIYSEPVEVNIDDDLPYRFDSPEDTVAAYWRAQLRGDVDALFAMSDEQAKELLRNHYLLEPGKSMPYAFDGATRMSILMRGELNIGDDLYILLYVRRISKNAEDGIISLQSTIVKKSGGRYQITELPRLSAFANIDRVAGVKCYPYGPYKTVVPKLQESQLPVSFFSIAP